MNYDELMTEFFNINQQIKELKSQKDDLRTQILTAIKIDGITETESDTHRLQFTISNRRSFEKEKAVAFLEAHEANMEEYYLESEYETLKIKAKKHQEVEE